MLVFFPSDKGQDKSKQAHVMLGWFWLGIRENFFAERMLRNLNRLPREEFKSCVDVLLTDWFMLELAVLG